MIHRALRILRKLAGLGPSVEHRIRELKRLGMEIGADCWISPDAEFEEAWASHVRFGCQVTVSRGVRFISHDASAWRGLGVTRVGVIEVGDRAFIGAYSIVLPHVRIGADTVVGAGSVVTRDIPDGMVAAGNPAKAICTTSHYLEKTKAKLDRSPCFGEEYRQKRGGTLAMRKAMLRKMPDGLGFIVSPDVAARGAGDEATPGAGASGSGAGARDPGLAGSRLGPAADPGDDTNSP